VTEDVGFLISMLFGPSATDMTDNFIELKIHEKAIRRRRRRAALKGWRTRRSKA
jgi:hypothetical protein